MPSDRTVRSNRVLRSSDGSMRDSFLQHVSGILVLALTAIAGCSSSRPPSHPPSPSPVAPTPSGLPQQAAEDPVPRVIRRIAKEQTALVEASRAMTAELTDPDGRERALAEANELAAELAHVSAALGSGD